MSVQSTNLALPFLAAGQAQKHITVNETLLRLDALVQLAAVSATVTAQPSSPSDGQVYILPAGKTGAAWGAMSNGVLAYYRDGAWEQITPREGFRAWVNDVDRVMVYTGAAWVVRGGGPQVTVYTSGAGTYTTPVSATWIDVELVGGGGGSGGSGTSPGAGAAGASSTFGSLTANGGAVGNSSGAAAAGGTASGGDTNISGGKGGQANGAGGAGQPGGCTAFGGNGQGSGAGAPATAGTANTGGGASGAGTGTGVVTSGGGGAGGYCRKAFTSPSATYAYSVGAGGAGGTAGTSGQAGAAGGSGIIVVKAHFT